MKTIKYLLLAVLALILAAATMNAQRGKRHYVNIGWQFNATVKNPMLNTAQGYGAYMESGYYLTPMLALGSFASFNTNNDYVSKKTYYFEDQSALTTDLSRSLYQMPFGTSLRLRFMRKMLQPYVEARFGSEYSSQSTYMSTFVSRDSDWGFYIAPEIGLIVYPFHREDFGFQIAAYYSYSTNEYSTYKIDGLNNLGLKIGLAF